MPQQIMRREAVELATGLKRASLYAKIAAGEFPRPIKIGPRAVGWPSKEIEDWQQARIAERDAKAD
jgi:prophage regulatory protein